MPAQRAAPGRDPDVLGERSERTGRSPARTSYGVKTICWRSQRMWRGDEKGPGSLLIVAAPTERSEGEAAWQTQ